MGTYIQAVDSGHVYTISGRQADRCLLNSAIPFVAASFNQRVGEGRSSTQHGVRARGRSIMMYGMYDPLPHDVWHV